MPRGPADKTKRLIEAAYEIARERQPISVRGVSYVVFETYGLITSMAKKETDKVGNALRHARNSGLIPWDWIVDTSRQGRTYNFGGYDTPEAYINELLEVNLYRKDYWSNQPYHLEVWSEKETIVGVIDPILRKWSVDFKNLRGFNSTSNVYRDAQRSKALSKPMVALYIGDYDISGLYMSECDLPRRLEEYEAGIQIVRIALKQEDTIGHAGHNITEKKGDPRFKWWCENEFGNQYWEVDGMDPRDLRTRLDEQIESYVDMAAWQHMQLTEAAEKEAIDRFYSFMREQAARYSAGQ